MAQSTQILLLVVLVCVTSIQAEYTWTGTDWKWQNPETKEHSVSGSSVSNSNSNAEGSGDDSPFGEDDTEDDYEDNYDYGDEDDDSYDYHYNRNQPHTVARTPSYTTSFHEAKKTPSLTSSFDDEDMTEGSGTELAESEDDSREGSGGGFVNVNTNWRYEVTNPPRKYQPTHVDPPPKQDIPKVLVKEEEDNDDTMYVDPDNVDVQYPPKGDVFFGGDNDREEEVYKNKVDVYTTTTTKKVEVAPKPTESPGVHKERPTNHPAPSFFAQPGILAAVIGGAVVGLLCAILLVMFIVYRMRKKDEGSYVLDEPKRAHNANSYSKPPSREFYA